MKVFLDTNVLIDFLSARPGMQDASVILNGGECKRYKLCASFLTFANIAYILRKLPKDELISSLIELSELIKVLKMDGKQLRAALIKPSSDLEDSLQYECAKAAGADVIVTNNTKHFEQFPMRVMTANDFVRSLNSI